MNRIDNPSVTRLWTGKRQRMLGLSDDPISLSSPNRLFFPEHFERRYPYPLFVWLHSEASSEYELDSVMPSISIRNYVGLAVRGTRTSLDQERRFDWGATLGSMQLAEQTVMAAIDEVMSQVPLARERIFIGGHGVGGTLAQWIGLRNCHRFAGVVSIHGAFPRRFKPLVRWKAARELPVLSMHGGYSSLCDNDQACRSIRLARSCGLSYRFVQYPTGDEMVSDMGAMSNQFMMDIVNGVSTDQLSSARDTSTPLSALEP